jgi:peroxisome-assembly ATPase
MLRLLAARAARASKRRTGARAGAGARGGALHPFSSSSSSSSSSSGIERAYLDAVARGALHEDASQRAAVAQLQLLQTAVVGRWRARVAAAEEAARAAGGPATSPPPAACLGAYLHGPVGTGKTALADLFLSTLPPPIPYRRHHFHSFMLAFHRRQHELLQALPKVVVPTRQGGGAMRVYRSALPPEDPIVTAAREIAMQQRQEQQQEQQQQHQQQLRGGGGGEAGPGEGAGHGPSSSSASTSASSSSSSSSPPPPPPSPLAVLVLDELQVADVADAMILARLFGRLTLHHGVSVVFTSNRRPGQLYEGGLSRRYFLPFVQLCESRLLDLRLLGSGGGGSGGGEEDGGGDYRRLRRRPADAAAAADGAGGGGVGAMFVGPGAAAALERAWRREQNKHQLGSEEVEALQVPVPAAGRALEVPRALLCGGGGAGASATSLVAAARFSFEELCGRAAALSSADYAALVGALVGEQQRLQRDDSRPASPPPSPSPSPLASPALFLSGVPARLCPRRQRDEARRLVTLLDVLYDAHAAQAGAAAAPTAAAAAGAGPAALAGASAPRLIVSLKDEGSGGAGGGALGPDSIFEALARERAEHAATAKEEEKEEAGLGTGGGAGGGGGRPAAAGDELPASLYAEEALMYRRAASRLAGLCEVVEDNAQRDEDP